MLDLFANEADNRRSVDMIGAMLIALVDILEKRGVLDPDEWLAAVPRALASIDQEKAAKREEWKRANPGIAKFMSLFEAADMPKEPGKEAT